MMHWVGLTKLTYEAYTPLALVNADPAAIHVRADSPHASLSDLIAAIKANPGKFKASGTGQGGSWHLALAGMLKSQGITPTSVPWVPALGPRRRSRIWLLRAWISYRAPFRKRTL
jgi:tripartite-type tricarboxylate transporter receptor subunit TctC